MRHSAEHSHCNARDSMDHSEDQDNIAIARNLLVLLKPPCHARDIYIYLPFRRVRNKEDNARHRTVSNLRSHRPHIEFPVHQVFCLIVRLVLLCRGFFKSCARYPEETGRSHSNLREAVRVNTCAQLVFVVFSYTMSDSRFSVYHCKAGSRKQDL